MRVKTTVPLRTQERNKPLIFSDFVDDCERRRTGEWWPRTESNHRHADFNPLLYQLSYLAIGAGPRMGAGEAFWLRGQRGRY